MALAKARWMSFGSASNWWSDEHKVYMDLLNSCKKGGTASFNGKESLEVAVSTCLYDQ